MGATTVVQGVAGSWLTNVHVMLVGKDAARRYTWSGVEEKRKTLFYAHIFSMKSIFFFSRKDVGAGRKAAAWWQGGEHLHVALLPRRASSAERDNGYCKDSQSKKKREYKCHNFSKQSKHQLFDIFI